MTGTIDGPLTVASGDSLVLTNATLNGDLSVDGAATLRITQSTVKGGIRADGARSLTICGSILNGPVSVSNTDDFVLLGHSTSESPSTCAPNTIFGDVALVGSHHAVTITGNRISGDVSVIGTGSSGRRTDGERQLEIGDNDIAGALSCKDNSPPPADGGRPNTIHGQATGQCSSL
jgi:hypothetical protein